MVLDWRARVKRHCSEHPFTVCELEAVAGQASDRQIEEVLASPHIAYGATVVAVLLTPSLSLFVQLGDGDILLVDDHGEVSRPPLPRDPALFADVTSSLCGRSAWQSVRSHFQPLSGHHPALVMLATDGYANSFVDENGFRMAGRDLQAALHAEGVQSVRSQLPGWLEATSRAGSGDDITVALAWRASCPHPVREVHPQRLAEGRLDPAC
jgi:hypothetical protein